MNTLANVIFDNTTPLNQGVRDDENAGDYDQEIMSRGAVIKDYIESVYDEDPATMEMPADKTVEEVVKHFYQFALYLLQQAY